MTRMHRIEDAARLAMANHVECDGPMSLVAPRRRIFPLGQVAAAMAAFAVVVWFVL